MFPMLTAEFGDFHSILVSPQAADATEVCSLKDPQDHIPPNVLLRLKESIFFRSLPPPSFVVIVVSDSPLQNFFSERSLFKLYVANPHQVLLRCSLK